MNSKNAKSKGCAGKLLKLLLIFVPSLLAAWFAANWAVKEFVVPEFKPSIMVPDTETGWLMQPDYDGMRSVYNLIDLKGKVKWEGLDYHVRTNSLGFRGEDIAPEDRNKYRVICIGDSSTFGWGEDERYTYPFILEKLLSRHFPARVYNLGAPGHSSYQGLLLFRKVANLFHPDMVVINYGANDSRDLGQRQLHALRPMRPDKEVFGDRWKPDFGEKLKYGVMNYLAPRFRNASLFYLFIKLAIVRSPEKQTGRGSKIPRVSVDDYRDNLEHIVTEAREMGASSALVVTCAPDEYQDAAIEVASKYNLRYAVDRRIRSTDMASIMASPEHRALLELVRRRHPAEVMRKNPALTFTNDHCHPNPLGHRIIADIIADAVIEMKLKGDR